MMGEPQEYLNKLISLKEISLISQYYESHPEYNVRTSSLITSMEKDGTKYEITTTNGTRGITDLFKIEDTVVTFMERSGVTMS